MNTKAPPVATSTPPNRNNNPQPFLSHSILGNSPSAVDDDSHVRRSSIRANFEELFPDTLGGESPADESAAVMSPVYSVVVFSHWAVPSMGMLRFQSFHTNSCFVSTTSCFQSSSQLSKLPSSQLALQSSTQLSKLPPSQLALHPPPSFPNSILPICPPILHPAFQIIWFFLPKVEFLACQHMELL